MAKSIMIQGTASNSGKSLLTAGLIRIFTQDGYKVSPFKSQNMALNSYITADGLEMGRAQVMQAEAAKINPDVRMNPILLKPTSDRRSQVIVNGEVLCTMKASDYFKFKTELIPHILNAYNSLAKENDIIVIEGAGSPAEINLKDNDIVNMGLAKMTNSPVLIVGDIDRGGVFASLYGTIELLEEDEKKLVRGTIINKFRGDTEILKPGLDMLYEITKKPVLGVVPHLNVKVDDEDSLTNRFSNNKMEKNPLIDIAVIRLPRISNFTDFNPIEYIDGVSLRYITNIHEFENPDLIIIPGTKSTIDDLIWLRESGFEAKIKKFAENNKPIIGICGGYQMLGEKLSDPLGIEKKGEIKGIGLLPHKTVFENKKTRVQTVGKLNRVTGIFNELSGQEYRGYEIHMGVSNGQKNIINKNNVYGTYIHGIFDKENITKIIISALLKEKGLSYEDIKTFDIEKFKQEQYDILADELRKSINMKEIYKIIEEGV